jgi:hypothetical protein
MIELAVVRIEQTWSYADNFTVGCESGRVGFSEREKDRKLHFSSCRRNDAQHPIFPVSQNAISVPANYGENQQI